MALKEHPAFEPVQLEFSFETAAPDTAEADLVRQMLSLNERLLRTYLDALRSESPARRRKAARGLGNLGRVGERAIPLLRDVARNDGNPSVREAASLALGQLLADED